MEGDEVLPPPVSLQGTEQTERHFSHSNYHISLEIGGRREVSGVDRIETSALALNPELQAALEKEYYADYGLTVHIPEATLRLLDIKKPKTKEEYLKLVKDLAANQRVVKYIDVHGWNATGDVWDIDTSEDKNDNNSWTAGQVKRSLKERMPVMVINPDVSNWGRSRLTEKGQISLKGGLEEFYASFMGRDQEEGEKSKKKKRISLASRITEPFVRESGPGSVGRTAEALAIVLNDCLKIDGWCIFNAHSQGVRVVNKLLEIMEDIESFGVSGSEGIFQIGKALAGTGNRGIEILDRLGKKKPNRKVIAFSLAGAETGHDRREELGGALLNFLKGVEKARLGVEIAQAIGIDKGPAELVNNFLTESLALEGLPDDIKKAIMSIHSTSGEGYETVLMLDLLYFQAVGWAYTSGSLCRPEWAGHFLASNDKLTPPKNYIEWLENSEFESSHAACKTEETPVGVDRMLSFFPTSQRERTIQFEGPHYFFLRQENKEEIQALIFEKSCAAMVAYDEMSHQLLLKPEAEIKAEHQGEWPTSEADLDNLTKGSLKSRLRYFAVSDDIVQGKSFDQRMKEVTDFLKREEGKKAKSEFPITVPITETEMLALRMIMKKLSLRELLAYGRENTIGGYMQDRLVSVLPKTDESLFTSLRKETIKDIFIAIDTFPFHFFQCSFLREEDLNKYLEQLLGPYRRYEEMDDVLSPTRREEMKRKGFGEKLLERGAIDRIITAMEEYYNDKKMKA